MEVQEEPAANSQENQTSASRLPNTLLRTQGRSNNRRENNLATARNHPQSVQETQSNHLESATELIRDLQESNMSSQLQRACDYCNQNFAEDEIQEHIEECDSRKIRCEICMQKVLLEIYDVHYNECSAEREEAGSQNEGGMEEERNDEASMYLPESSLTYEQLLLLDDTIEKKGLTAEQLKRFRVTVYVKSLDGEGFCNICMSHYNTGEYTRELSCRHKFHDCCVDRWLGEHITCPNCKKYLR